MTFHGSPSSSRSSKPRGRSSRAPSAISRPQARSSRRSTRRRCRSTRNIQSTNEELLASKEELQSLNEELTALNSQLQETLEKQRTTSNDLQNILYSTDVATLFLDTNLNIRFFTPATRSLFNVIPGDMGRPLADLKSLSADGALLATPERCCGHMPRSSARSKRKAASGSSVGYCPTAPMTIGVEGVVITFADITQRRHTADALAVAKRQAELANIAKSRFLAAASHDLRQPLQTLTLLQGLLAKTAEGEKAQKLVARLDETLGAMSGMLNTLLDINQIEAGTVHAEIGRVSRSTISLTGCGTNSAITRKREGWRCARSRAGFRFAAIRACSSR